MIALETIQTISLSVGIPVAIATLIIALFAIFEKVTGAFGRWFERHFKESLESTNSVIQELRTEVWAADSFNRYHLGPNGDSIPIHRRIEIVESKVEELAAQDDRLRQLLQAAIAAEKEDS